MAQHQLCGSDLSGETSLYAPVEPSSPRDATTDLRAFGVAGAAGVGLLSILPNLGPLCPLRRLTGVPCPLCGGTTAALAVTRGDLAGAVAASPLAVIVFLAVAAAWLWWMLARFSSVPEPVATGRLRGPVAKVAVPILVLSWIFQLHRYDFI